MIAEATGAREALDLTEDEVSVTLSALEDFAHAVGERVGAIACEPDRWHRTETIQANATLAITAGCVIAKLTSMFSRSADAEGMVEEGLGAPTPKSDGGLSPWNTSPAPTPFIAVPNGAQAGDQPQGLHDACGQQAGSLQDGRVWWLTSRGGASNPPWDGWNHQINHDAIPVVPRSELARVQRERDEARLCAKYETDVAEQAIAEMEKARKDGETAILFAEKRLHEVQLELSVARLEGLGFRNRIGELEEQVEQGRKNLSTACEERDAALDRARVAEQRIETGWECWHSASGSVWFSEPSARDVSQFGPFTRGRFVADTEET